MTNRIEILALLAVLSALSSLVQYFIGIPFIVSVLLIASSIIPYVFVKTEKKLYFILFAYFFLFTSVYSIFVDSIDLIKGKEYKIKGNITGKSLEVITLNGKYPKEKCYIRIPKNEYENGQYNLIVKIVDIKENGKRKFFKGEITGSRPAFLNGYRKYIREKLFDISYKYDGELYGFLKATVLGEGDYIDKETSDNFKYTGTAHIYVISGSHIALIILFVLKILSLINLPYRVKYITALVFLTFYVSILGFGDSVLRAYLMGVIFLLSKIAYEKADIKKSFYVSIIISLFINPSSLFNISFQLTYLAVASLIFICPKFKRYMNNFFSELAVTSIVVQVVLTPIFLIYFHKLTLFTFVANIVAVPIGSIVVEACFVALSVSIVFGGLSVFMGYFLDVLIKIFYFYLRVFANIPFLQITYFEKVSIIFVIVFYISLIFCIFGDRFKIYERIIISSLLILISLNLNFAVEPKKYDSQNFSYFRVKSIGVLLVNSDISEREIFELKDNDINSLDYIVTTKERNVKLLCRIFKVNKTIFINENKEIEIDGVNILMEKGKIYSVQKGV